MKRLLSSLKLFRVVGCVAVYLLVFVEKKMNKTN